MDITIRHDERGHHGTFLAMQDGQHVGEMSYHRASATLAIIDHTEVLPALRGQGVARKLFDAAVAWARGNNVKLGATCSYAVVQLARDTSLQDTSQKI